MSDQDDIAHAVRVSKRNQYGFTPFQVVAIWTVLIVMLSATSTLAHTRYVCQGFKDEGRFYYGMDIRRCVGVLIRRPLATAEDHLGTLNRSY